MIFRAGGPARNSLSRTGVGRDASERFLTTRGSCVHVPGRFATNEPVHNIASAYYLALSAGYAFALLGWLLIDRGRREIWGPLPDAQFARPWRETLWALLAAIAAVGTGMLYSRHLLLPEISAKKSPFAEAANQLLIFSPFPALLILRQQPLASAWLPARKLPIRFLAGLVLAVSALIVFCLIRRTAPPLLQVISGVYQPKNFGYAAQVFLEDFAIAVLFVRLRAALGRKWFLVAIVTVALLFSSAHYPAKLAGGQAFLPATLEVLLDAALVSAVIYFLQRSRDFLWFWCIHFTMDMLQFYGGDPTK